ncbi:hypothetical protein [Halioxenophilus aromaticivorans]|uniref:Exonuclease domain-containing protein n=1 Tax=Halioxenophilus aromaticivorans TaxID=1306992 RepID=A0AAV3TYI0_9ALTE
MQAKSPKRRSFTHRLRPQIIDVEASGFGSDSYPIEIGVVLANGLRFSRVIRPLPDWNHWDERAEELHGISQKELQRHGHNPFQVARELNELLAGQTVYSDGWAVDKPWVDKLYNRLAIERKFFISPIESIVSEKQIEQWKGAMQQLGSQITQPAHRALNDAVLIQETYVLTRMQSNTADVMN